MLLLLLMMMELWLVVRFMKSKRIHTQEPRRLHGGRQFAAESDAISRRISDQRSSSSGVYVTRVNKQYVMLSRSAYSGMCLVVRNYRMVTRSLFYVNGRANCSH
uniref:Putative secreted protein n=1 Tax=Anopheles darlingi TaxID=43151 RepID=A0A2M4DJ51_ANODA